MATISNHNVPVEIQRVALYARVSTQRDQDPEMQLREFRQYAERRAVRQLRSDGLSWSEVCRAAGLSKGTAPEGRI